MSGEGVKRKAGRDAPRGDVRDSKRGSGAPLRAEANKGSDKKNKSAYAWKGGRSTGSKNAQIRDMSRGFIFSVPPGLEARAVKEAYFLLNEYTDKLYGEEKIGEDVEEIEGDIQKALDAELQGLKKESKHRYNTLRLGQGHDGALAVACNDDNIDITKVAEAIVNDAKAGNAKTRLIQKLKLVHTTCYAEIEDIVKQVAKLIESHPQLGSDTESVTFAIDFKCRGNDKLKRAKMDIIGQLAALMKTPPHKVNLDDPDYTFCIHIYQGSVSIGIAPAFRRLKQYNLFELSGRNQADILNEMKAHAERMKQQDKGKGKKGAGGPAPVGSTE